MRSRRLHRSEPPRKLETLARLYIDAGMREAGRRRRFPGASGRAGVRAQLPRAGTARADLGQPPPAVRLPGGEYLLRRREAAEPRDAAAARRSSAAQEDSFVLGADAPLALDAGDRSVRERQWGVEDVAARQSELGLEVGGGAGLDARLAAFVGQQERLDRLGDHGVE